MTSVEVLKIEEAGPDYVRLASRSSRSLLRSRPSSGLDFLSVSPKNADELAAYCRTAQELLDVLLPEHPSLAVKLPSESALAH